MSNKFDSIVIGSGPGGYVCAIRLAQNGHSVAIIEKNKNFGGTCLNVGCIPSKALLHASHVYEQSKNEYSKMGINVKPSINIKELLNYKEAMIKSNTDGISFLFKKNKIVSINGSAEIISNNSVKVTNGKNIDTYTASNIIIATGSTHNTIPGVDIDEKHIISSTGGLSLDRVPDNLLIIGAGYIGIELGSVWSRLGSKVTFVEAFDKILPNTDDECGEYLRKLLEKRGMKFILNTKVESVKKEKNALKINLINATDSSKSILTSDIVMQSVGRKPYVEGLGLDSIGLKLDKFHNIDVDKNFQTSEKNIYAIGDVINGPMLAHKAEEEGVAVADIICGKYGHVNYDVIPSVIYCDPEIASVGKTESDLKEEKIEYKVGKFPFIANGRAKVNNQTEGFVKILSDAETDKVHGIHIVGSDAGNLIGEAVLALEFGASSEDIARTCHAHPTLTESLKEAALDVDNMAIHK
ncbi:MAG: dihydrolipoyl dehydrogenase [Rhodobiaceae bacterium]|nr:dihydrolipoyl dehydrogenase [Rhodobiaceae bacterium]|tara:strand:+ start:1174 stop:2574 length:1401 start_codon:yes stop_codon:yes gene_type:complete